MMKQTFRAMIAAILAVCLFTASLLSVSASESYISYAGYVFSLHNKQAHIHAYEGDEDDLYIPEIIWNYTVAGIDDYAFFNRSDLSYLYLEYSGQLVTIGKYAFYGCSAFPYAEIPSRVETLGEGAFQGCTSLEEVVINSQRLTAIESQTFSGCTSLQKAVIPASVETISDSAFAGCENVTIWCWYNSAAHTFAKQKGMDYVLFDPPYSLRDAQLSLDETAFRYDGSEHAPAATLTYNGGELEEGKDYTLTVTPLTKPGTSTVTATGKREFGGEALATFTVKNVLGDADGNGEVNIADATLMQRVIAGYDDDHCARANALCDFNGDGLNIADVTAVQRRLADLEVPYPIDQMTDVIV